MRACAKLGNISLSVGIWYFGLRIALFSFFGSMHTQSFPGFLITTKLLIHAVYSVTGFIMPFL